MNSHKKGTVLVVDDDEDTADMFALLLESEGFTAVIARDGREAVAKALAVKPFLVLMDLSLPDRTGFDVCKTLRDTVRRSRIVAVTGYPIPRIEAELHKSGFHDAVQKPVGIEAVRRLLRDAGLVDAHDITPLNLPTPPR